MIYYAIALYCYCYYWLSQAREKSDKRRLILKLMLNLFDPTKSHAVRTHLQTAKAKLQSSADATTAGIDDVTSTTSASDVKSVKSSSVSTMSSNGTSPSRSVQRHTSSSTSRRRSLSTNGASQKDQQVCDDHNEFVCYTVYHIVSFCCDSSPTTRMSILFGCTLYIWLTVHIYFTAYVFVGAIITVHSVSHWSCRRSSLCV
jgi:hypothetical protein